ncbi:MAG: DUF5668 domain-containing protein [Candidatus Bipolaricaulota bacterium]
MRTRGNIVLPLLLILAGVILLLNNLGHLPWTVWATIGRLWPILLIALGLDILFGRVLRWALGVVLVVLVGIAVALALFGPAPIGPSESLRIPLGGAARAEVTLVASVGAVVVRASSIPLLVGGTLVAPWPDRGKWTSDRVGDTARFSLTMDRKHDFPTAVWPDRSRVTVELAPSVPMALRTTLGEGTASLDLTGLTLTELTVQGGSGRVTVTLPSRGQLVASVSSGTGEVTVHIPAGMAARIRVEGRCGPVDVVGDYQAEDGVFTSPGYETAAQRVDLTVRANPGRVTVLSPKSL